MQWLLSACKWCVVAPKNPHTRCKWQTQQAWWQRVFVNSNRRVTLLRVSASTAVSLQLMWLNYFVNRPYNTLSDYVTLFLCCIFEYQVDTTLKRDIKRFWWNLERFQTQWCLLGAMLFLCCLFSLKWNMKVSEHESPSSVIFYCGVNEILFETCEVYGSIEFGNDTVFVQGFESNHFHQIDCIHGWDYLSLLLFQYLIPRMLTCSLAGLLLAIETWVGANNSRPLWMRGWVCWFTIWTGRGSSRT